MGQEPTAEYIRDMAAGQQTGHQALRLQEGFHQGQGEAAEGDRAGLQALDHPSHVVLQVAAVTR